MKKAREGIVDQREAIDFCAREEEVLTVSKEVDPVYEIASITKSFDGGPTLVFEKIRGYPEWRVVTNLLARRERLARYFGTTTEGLPKRILEAVKNPIPSKLVRQAHCQENIITENIDVLRLLPVITQTKLDIGPLISGGVAMIAVPEEMGGGERSFNLSFHRLNPGLGNDWLSLASLYNRHFLEVLYYHKSRKEEYPITINIGLSPALDVVAAGGAFPQIRPIGADDLGVAGNLHGQAVEICKAKTVDAYALARAEIVLEGRVLYNEKITENPPSESAERSKGPEKVYFFPEFMGYQGLADRAFKVQITAITFRNNADYYTPLGDSVECSNLGATVSEASIYNACKNTAPNIFMNCHIPYAMRGVLGAVIQCRVTHMMQQGISQNLISAAFGAVKDLKWVIAVDEDVDIYDPTDILWAVNLRTRADEDINIIKGAGIGNLFATKWSVDTTVPISEKWRSLRSTYEPIDLSRCLTSEEVSKGFALMREGEKKYRTRQV